MEHPRYLPNYAANWADQHKQWLAIVASNFADTGSWPTINGLTRQLAREGHAVNLDEVFRAIPRPLGCVENSPDRLILFMFGLRLTDAGRPLLDGVVSAVKLAWQKYCSDEEPPVLTHADLDRNNQITVSDILLREAPFLGSGSGKHDEAWSREVTNQIVSFSMVESADDYLQIRAAQLGGSAVYGFVEDADQRQTAQSNAAAGSGIATPSRTKDVFISHASEDKDAVARPLAEELTSRGYAVWFDEYELVLGDSLREKIEAGLAQSTVGVVVLSPAFFGKPWPQQELNGLYSRLASGESNVIVPVWHELSHEAVGQHAPMLKNLLAGDSASGIPALADAIERTLARRNGTPNSTGEHTGGTGLAVSGRPHNSGLIVENEFACQSTMGVHKPPSSRIRWTPVFRITHTGTQILSISDIVPMGPALGTQDGKRVRFRRVATSSQYRAYPTLGALTRAQLEETDDDWRYVEEWPLIIAPGNRLRVTVQHEYAIELDDLPMAFESDEYALDVLAAYFHLERVSENGVAPQAVVLPTRIVCGNNSWEVDVPYLIMPVGSTLILPSEEESAESLERDELT